MHINFSNFLSPSLPFLKQHISKKWKQRQSLTLLTSLEQVEQRTVDRHLPIAGADSVAIVEGEEGVEGGLAGVGDMAELQWLPPVVVVEAAEAGPAGGGRQPAVGSVEGEQWVVRGRER